MRMIVEEMKVTGGKCWAAEIGSVSHDCDALHNGKTYPSVREDIDICDADDIIRCLEVMDDIAVEGKTAHVRVIDDRGHTAYYAGKHISQSIGVPA